MLSELRFCPEVRHILRGCGSRGARLARGRAFHAFTALASFFIFGFSKNISCLRRSLSSVSNESTGHPNEYVEKCAYCGCDVFIIDEVSFRPDGFICRDCFIDYGFTDVRVSDDASKIFGLPKEVLKEIALADAEEERFRRKLGRNN